MPLTHLQAKAYYDRFGPKQDAQSFYEDPAINRMLSAAEFRDAGHVFEFGCGTGRLAERLMREELPASASYLGTELSPVMADLARRRLAAFSDRSGVQVTDGSIRFPVASASVDRVIATYVLDLLADDDIRLFVQESRRVLRPGGRLALTSLVDGGGPISRAVARLWKIAYRFRPMAVGGCRPIQIAGFLAPGEWEILFREVVTPFCVPSEAVVARKE